MPQNVPDIDSIRALNSAVTEEFRTNGGKVGGQFEGGDLLLLTTTGAKSGQSRLSPLAYFRVDGKLLIVGSFAGAEAHPGWVHNLRANASAHIEVGNDSSDVTARELSTAERDEVYPKLTAIAPVFAEYQAKTSRVIPIFELRPTS